MFKMLLLATMASMALSMAAAQPRTAAAKPPDPLAPIVDDPKLPRVLIIGDSISMGYIIPVRELLAGKANVHHPPENCGPTSTGVKQLEKWLGKGKWDVIHFNFGLHDLKRVEHGAQQIPPDQYEKNLRAIVKRLKRTKAKLIWANTTPVPLGKQMPPRYPDDAVWYNWVAEKVMHDNDIAINDLYSFVLPRMKEIQLPVNVHFNQKGYEALAEVVASRIQEEL